MDCESVNNLLSAYIDGELSPRDVRKVESHLAHCVRCKEDIVEIRGVKAMLNNAGHEQPSPGFWADTVQRIREAPRHRVAFHNRVRAVPIGATAIAVLLALGMLLLPNLRHEERAEASTIDPAELVSLHADLRTDRPLADAGSMRYVFTDMRTNELPPASNTEVD